MAEAFDRISSDRRCVTRNMKSIYECIKENFWINYFSARPMGTWIDFETEIKKICTGLEKYISNKKEIYDLSTQICCEDVKNNVVLREIYQFLSKKRKEDIKTYKDLIDILENDLKALKISFNNYICYWVNQQECLEISPDIIEMEIDKVLSFNYSNTFQRVYNYTNNTEFSYIHGKACYTGNKANLVIGYDASEAEGGYPFTIPFKKYYQRVLIQADDNYLKWIEEIKENKEDTHKVCFFGHSMDVTDKDVICELILNENVETIIYYYNDEDKKQKLQNLANTIGYTNFKQYTKYGRIKLVRQQRFLEKKYSEEYKNKMIVKAIYAFPYISEEAYEIIKEWINGLSQNHFCKKKYLYMCIDGLQINNVNNGWIEKIKEKIEQKTKEPYSVEEFKEESLRYHNENLEKENSQLYAYIASMEKGINKNEILNSVTVLSDIKLKYFKIERMVFVGIENYVNKEGLEEILNLFNKFLNLNSRENTDIYQRMAKFLTLVKKEIVKDFFENINNADEMYYYRMKYLQENYDNICK